MAIGPCARRLRIVSPFREQCMGPIVTSQVEPTRAPAASRQTTSTPAPPGRRRWNRLGPSIVPAALLSLFLVLPLVGLLLRAINSGGLLSALSRPLVLDA